MAGGFFVVIAIVVVVLIFALKPREGEAQERRKRISAQSKQKNLDDANFDRGWKDTNRKKR